MESNDNNQPENQPTNNDQATQPTTTSNEQEKQSTAALIEQQPPVVSAPATPVVTVEEQPATKLCSKCMMFYGPIAFNYLCSKCFKESGGVVATAPKQSTATSQTQATNLPAGTDSEMKDETKTVEEQKQPVDQPPQRAVQEDKTKCWSCKKKVGLLGVQCRCEYVFCSKHRYPEEHQCDFNFDSFYKKKLESENQKIAVKKVDKNF